MNFYFDSSLDYLFQMKYKNQKIYFFFGIIKEGRLNQFSCLSKPEKNVILIFLDIKSEAKEKLNPSSALINHGISKTLLLIKDLDNLNLFLGSKIWAEGFNP